MTERGFNDWSEIIIAMLRSRLIAAKMVDENSLPGDICVPYILAHVGRVSEPRAVIITFHSLESRKFRLG